MYILRNMKRYFKWVHCDNCFQDNFERLYRVNIDNGYVDGLGITR